MLCFGKVAMIYNQLSSIITKLSLITFGLREILNVFDEEIKMTRYPLGVLISSLKEKTLTPPWHDPRALQTSHSQDPALPKMIQSCNLWGNTGTPGSGLALPHTCLAQHLPGSSLSYHHPKLKKKKRNTQREINNNNNKKNWFLF